eukprot:s1467_g4.t1
MTDEMWYSGPQSRSEASGSASGHGVQRSKDGVPMWSGESSLFEEYVEACLLYEQTVVKEKRYLCGPRVAAELQGPARRVLIGKPADWLSHEGGVRKLIAALRNERGQPKVPEMSELLMKYFKGTRRHRGESMGDFILRKAEAYTRAQQSMARYQRGLGHERREQPSVTSVRSSRESNCSQGGDGVDSNDFQDPMEEQDEQQEGQTEEWRAGGWEQPDTSEWGKHLLPEILPDFIQGWYLFMDSGLDVMERNVLHAELRGDFGVRAVEEVLRKHWTDADLRKRDAEKGRYMSNLAMDGADEPQGYVAEWSMDELEAEGFSAEEIGAIAQEEEKARAAWVAMQDARRTLKDARARQHAVRMSRQYYPSRPGGKGDGNLWKQMGSSKPAIQCFRCGGPHKIADCKEKPKSSEQANTATETAPFVFWSSQEPRDGACELAWGTSEMEQACVTTSQVVSQGKAVLDGGATRTIGSIEALESLANINVEKRVHTGIEKVDLSERPVFGFGNSSKNQCASTASVSVPMGGKMGTLKIHALDQGSAPILLSVHSLRKLGAIVDFENDMAVFRHVDPTRVIQLERSAAGHQIMPLTEDVYQSARQLKCAVPSFKDLE